MSPEIPAPRQRISSIDVLRGAVMLIMAIDHTRDFFHQPAFLSDPTNLATTTPFIFFTRWITHFCAPIFVFLSGISAFISGQKKTKKELSVFLIKRGLWLVLVELVIITLAITFNPLYNVFILQVIWAIGWSMVILGLLIRTSYWVILVVGLLLFFGHNITDYISRPAAGSGLIWSQVLMTSGGAFLPITADRFVLVAYAILPWTGVMLLGYSFAVIYKNGFDVDRRISILFRVSAALLGLFVILRFFNGYGDPTNWSGQKNGLFTFLSFINVTKYPISLQYACMTLGIGIFFLAILERMRNGLTNLLTVYGRVPFFYYVLHFYLIHFLCVIFFFASGRGVDQIVDPNSPFLFRPIDFGYPLWVVYLVWLLVISLLYRPCKWFNRYRQTHTQWWLSYM